jgi:hypothetical protein
VNKFIEKSNLINDGPILSLLQSEWERKERIRKRLNAPNLSFAILKRYRDIYRAIIGTKISVEGILVSEGGKFHFEMPPKELIAYYPDIWMDVKII